MYIHILHEFFIFMNLCAATFDVRSISVDGPVIRGCVCLTVEYVDGHEQPPRTFVLFNCTTRESDSRVLIIDGTVQCTQLPPHTSYDIIATDYDASDDINTTAAVTILGVAVPDYTITPSSTTPYTANTPTTGTVTHQTYNMLSNMFHCHFRICNRILSITSGSSSSSSSSSTFIL